jgi:AcrR family transcriptional regulator
MEKGADSSRAEPTIDEAPRKRTRRTGAEVRALVLRAARSVFASRGFAGTTTREVAGVAGVAEALVFRHFGSKNELFERAVVDPLDFVIDQLVSSWEGYRADPHDAEKPIRDYVESLYSFLENNREMVLGLISAMVFDVDELSGTHSPSSSIQRVLNKIEFITEEEKQLREFDWIDVPMITRLTFSMVLSSVIFQGSIFPKPQRPADHKRVIDQIVNYSMHGFAHPRPPSGA